MGVTVTFVAILELVREGLIDIVQTEAYAPLHVRGAQGARGLKLAVDNDAAEEHAISEVVGESAFEAVPEAMGEAEPEAEAQPPQMDGETHE